MRAITNSQINKDMFITVPQNTEIFRGSSVHNSVIGNWYTPDSNSARGYGTVVKRYKIKRDLKLINLLSDQFHKDFIEKLVIEFPGADNDGRDLRKMMLLVPLGLPDSHFQNEIATRMLGITSSPPTDPYFHSFWKTINNVSRFSEYTLDKEFADKFVQIYGALCDGFILPLKCPNIPQGGIFHREMYIIDTSNIEYVSDVVLATPGGSREEMTVKPLHYFKTDRDYQNFLESLEKDITNPYLNRQIKNGFVTGDFDTNRRGISRRIPKSPTRFTRKAGSRKF